MTTPEARIQHCYPEALVFLRRHGADALAIVDDLVAHSQRRGDQLVVQASVREIATRLSFLSKDTVHRRLRQLLKAQVIVLHSSADAGPFEAPTYVLDLTDTGISVLSTRRSA
jgi:SOS-response transcriptional repressor LexA